MHKRGKPCGVCLDRCPFGALTESGFDRALCYGRCKANAELYRDLGKADVCGKCLADLPCSTGVPS